MKDENMLDFLRAEIAQARLRKDTEWVTVVSTAVAELQYQFGEVVSHDQLIKYAKAQISALEKAKLKAKERKIDTEIKMPELQQKLYDMILPPQLTYDDLLEVLVDSTGDTLGTHMKFLKEHYNGQYDGKIAKQAILDFMSI
ncbi:hypothetical protein [Proteus phage RP7]|nr:hypothetical protein [Proteus phage RP7]